MTQNWGPPNYPPRPPQYQQPPQYQLPEPDYGYEGPGDSTGKRALFFLTGSCATLLVVACCVLVLAVGWVVDERLGITTPRQEPAAGALPDEPFVPAPPVQFTAPAPLQPAGQETQPAAPQSLTPPAPQAPPPAEPVVIGQPVAAGDAAIELVVLDLQRTVQPNNLAAAPGMEFVSVSVQLRSTQAGGAAKEYHVTDFQLQNAQEVLFQPDPQADNGRRLQDGELPDGGIVEGDILFHVPLGEAPLFLVWHAPGSAELYTVILQ